MRAGELKSRTFAKQLRRQLTRAEVILWARLRRHDFGGRKFRRQHPIGCYIADFACVECRLVLEVDGATHATPEERAYDARRDAYMRRHKWRVMRVRNDDVYHYLDGVLEMLADAIAPSGLFASADKPPPP